MSSDRPCSPELIAAHYDNVADLFEEEARAWEKVLESLEELKEYYGKTAN